MTEVHARPGGTTRSRLASTALIATVVSALGLVVMIGGQALGVPGFSGGGGSAAAADAAWLCFALGWLVALGAGAVAWARGRRRASAGDVRAGRIAIGYVVFAILLTVVTLALM